MFDDEVMAAIRDWVPTQRWFPRKGERVDLRLIARLPLGDDAWDLLIDAEGVLLQVPVAARHAPGVAPIARLGDRWLVDGCHDTEAVLGLLRPGSDHTVLGTVPDPTRTHVLVGEQSNTSIIGDGAAPWIAKVLRVVAPGAHPDVEVTRALTTAGCTRVPSAIAAVATRLDVGDCTLVAVSELVEGARDAWAMYLDDAAAFLDGGTSGMDAAGLGAAVAEVHTALEAAFGTHEATAVESAALVDDLRARLAWALEESGELLAPLAAALAAHGAALGSLQSVGALQRIHGDLHLGQVLHHPERGDLLLDFEGEPLRPLDERSLPQPAVRDVAGLLRSIDYAAATVAMDRGVEVADLEPWAEPLRSTLLDGYRRTRALDETSPLLRALVIDKALYEVVYELRNRPDWAEIPRGALERMLEG